MSDCHGRALSLTGELALDADGKFLAIRCDDRADLGAYGGRVRLVHRDQEPDHHDGRRLPHPRDVRAARGSPTPTRCRSRPIAAPAGRTSPTPSSGWSTTPRTSTASTRSSCGAGISSRPRRCRTRRRTRATYDSGDFEAVMDDALERADWAGFPARSAAAAARGQAARHRHRDLSRSRRRRRGAQGPGRRGVRRGRRA